MLFNKQSQIIRRKELLSINYLPEKIIGRENEINEIAFHLSYAFREYPSLPQKIVFGCCGTGKTTVILYVLKEFEKEIREHKLKCKIVKLKASESKSKYEILKKSLEQIAPDVEVTSSTSDIYAKLVSIIAERGLFVLFFIDEIHELNDNDLNGVLYSLSRIGQDISFSEVKEYKLEKNGKGQVGYIIVSNNPNIRAKLKENTKSTLTRETLVFKRYTPGEIVNILRDRINLGALYDNVIEEGVLEMIAGLSVKECQDARYGLLLLSNVAEECEKRGNEKITMELVNEINIILAQDYLKKLMLDMPELYIEILLIIYNLHLNNDNINSQTIYEEYKKNPFVQQVSYSRISQVVSALEKENVVYVTQSKKTKLRDLSIAENFNEIQEVLKERDKI